MNDPIVYPEIDDQGIETSPVLSALFDVEMDEGNIDFNKILLIKKETDISENTIKQIPAVMTSKRIALSSLDEVETLDDGTSLERGSLYRTQFILTPSSPLDQNSDYSAVIPKEMSLRSVFDTQASVPGGSPSIDARGPFKGLSEDSYQIIITEEGSQSKAIYTWKRLSDNHEETGHRARRRFVELEKGLRIVFPTGEYKVGDSFLIKVIPAQSIQKIYSWNFSTGNHNHSTPDSERSDSVVDLPVNNPDSLTETSTPSFSYTAIPILGESQVTLGKKSTVLIGNISIQTRENSSAFNLKKIEVLGGTTLGNESINELDNLITITISEGETTNLTIINLINTAYPTLEAMTLLELGLALLCPVKRFSRGNEEIQIEIIFSKDIDPASVTDKTIKVIAEDLITFSDETLYYSYEINGKILTIKIED